MSKNTGNNEIKKRYRYKSDGMLEAQVKRLGYSVIEMAGDGNCLFRSISDQLYGDSSKHFDVRKSIVGYLEENAGEFSLFVTEDYNNYLRRMLKSGEWGGALELMAASRLYDVLIIVHIPNAPRYEVGEIKKPSMKVIQVAYHDGQHYNSIRDHDGSLLNDTVRTCRLTNGSLNAPTPNSDSKQKLTEQIVLAIKLGTGCEDEDYIHELLYDYDNDVIGVMEYIDIEKSNNNQEIPTDMDGCDKNDDCLTKEKLIKGKKETKSKKDKKDKKEKKDKKKDKKKDLDKKNLEHHEELEIKEVTSENNNENSYEYRMRLIELAYQFKLTPDMKDEVNETVTSPTETEPNNTNENNIKKRKSKAEKRKEKKTKPISTEISFENIIDDFGSIKL